MWCSSISDLICESVQGSKTGLKTGKKLEEKRDSSSLKL